MADPYAQFQDADPYSQFQNAQATKAAAPPKPQQTSQGLGFYQGLMKPLDNAATALEGGLNRLGVPTGAINSALGLPSAAQAQQSHAAYIASQAAKGVQPGGYGRFAGEIAGTLPVSVVSDNPLALGAMSGALLSDAKTPQQLATDTGIGAIGGKFGSAAINAVSRAVQPVLSPAVKMLIDAGAKLTPGQIMGGAANRVEDAATSIPLVGDMIGSGQKQAINSLNIAAGNRALAPIGQTLPSNISAGHDMTDYISSKLGDAYDNLLPNLSAKLDPQFTNDMANIVSNHNLPPAQASRLQDIITAQVGKAQNGTLTGQDLHGIDQELRRTAQGYGSDPSFDNRDLGQQLGKVRDAVRDMLIRQNPNNAGELSQINTGYANYARIRQAASSVAAPDGVFTPAQLYAATKSGDQSVGKGAFARGDALMQDLAGAGKNVISSKVPDSGTATRSMIGLAATGALAHVNPAAAIGVLAATGAYTKPGLAILQTVLTQRPQAAAQIANLIAQGKTPAAVAAANALVNQFSPQQRSTP